MKNIALAFTLLIASASFTLQAQELEIIYGEEAYAIFKELPGVKCVEWRQKDQIVYSKSQTKSCKEKQTDDSKWSCVAQLELKNNKVVGLLSADCSRELK